jgi:hypothetical protein
MKTGFPREMGVVARIFGNLYRGHFSNDHKRRYRSRPRPRVVRPGRRVLVGADFRGRR